MSKLKQFLLDAETKAFDQGHRATIKFNIGKYNAAVQRGLTQYSDHELARERGSFIKTNTINNLDKYLMEFESNFTARGGKVIWARNAEEALKRLTEEEG